MSGVDAQHVFCLGIAAAGLSHIGAVPRLSLQPPPLASTANGGALTAALILATASLACEPAGLNPPGLAVSYFLEPARIGLEAALSNIDDDDYDEAPCTRCLSKSGRAPPAAGKTPAAPPGRGNPSP